MVDLVTDAMTESDRDGGQSYVVFRLGGEGYALEVMRVQEVLDILSMTEVPGSPKCLLGVINLRGRVVPVYDLRIPFGLSNAANVDRAECPDRRDRARQRYPGNGSRRRPRFRRPGVLSRAGASVAPARTWENDAICPRADPSPGRFSSRIGSGSGFFCPGIVEW